MTNAFWGDIRGARELEAGLQSYFSTNSESTDFLIFFLLLGILEQNPVYIKAWPVSVIYWKYTKTLLLSCLFPVVTITCVSNEFIF